MSQTMPTPLKGLIILLSILTLSYSCQTKVTLQGSLLIKNGLIVDGSGAMGYVSDLLVSNGNITWIGNAERNHVTADRTIDASGKIVAPGFIDIHAHGDPLNTAEFENFLAMGVTSIALGMDGSSVKSKDMRDWMSQLDTMTFGVNILPFIGHGTVRSESGIRVSQEVSEEQLMDMTALVDSALALGCWGLSMGLEYLPGYYADSTELTALAKTVGAHNAIITSHIRNEDNDAVDQSIDEMITLADYCKVNISHLKVVYGKGKQRAKEILYKLENTASKKYTVTADLYPYTASYTGIGIVFPKWARNPKKYKEVKIRRGQELLTYLKNKITQRNGPEATLFGTGPYAGKTLQDLVLEYQQPYEIILRDIIGPYGASAAYFVMNDELQQSLMKHPTVMIGSDGSPTMRHPRGYGSFAKVIEDYTVKDSILRLEEAIYKMSGLPAKTMGLYDRGTITSGAVADLLIFDPTQIKNNATFDNPHKLASGVEVVIIKGEVIRENGQTINRNGKLIRRD